MLGGAEGEARLRPASGLTYFELPPSRLDSVEVPPFVLRAAQGSDPLLFRVSLDSPRPQVAVLRGKLRVVDVDDDLAFTAPAENTPTTTTWPKAYRPTVGTPGTPTGTMP